MRSHDVDLERRCADLTAQVGKLVQADVQQRTLIMAVRRYLHTGTYDPRRLKWILDEIEEVLGLDGVGQGDPVRIPKPNRVGRYRRKGVPA